jgi:hypothetical protein
MNRGALALLCVLWPALFLGSGCASAQWKPTGAERESGPRGSSFAAPGGWMMASQSDDTVLSIDGPQLQAIHVTFHGEMPATKAALDPAAPPSELAELYIAELQNLTGSQVEVVENTPATVAGKPGFRLRVRHNRHAQHAPVDAYEIYAVGHGSGLYVLSYGAFETYLFERDRAAFEELVKSFQLPP